MRRLAFVLIPGFLGLSMANWASAQTTQHVTIKSTSANTKTTQRVAIPVGDIPGHVVVAFKAHRTFPDNPPVIDGLKLVEVWDSGAADLTSGNGTFIDNDVYVMENGDKFFVRSSVVGQSVAGKITTMDVGYISGGTGKLVGMQGVVRGTATFDPSGKTNYNEKTVDIDYSIGK